ncbi:hypothetical protein ACFW4X_15210 [Streptomyces smyrnaeus]|uniref:hypothetical protein n=1 Tax=Streptomyces smyrnaeus TaxID=1387713 RepID=UPI00369B4F1F
MALLLALAGCGESSPKPPEPSTKPSGETSAEPSDKKGFGTVFDTERKIRATLPQPESMAGWTPKNGRAHVEEQPDSPSECGADTHWDCTAVGNGSANYEAAGETVIFSVDAFPDTKAAQAACRKEESWSAKYTKKKVPPLSGVTSHAYYRNAGGLDGLDLTMCTGTVIAQVRLEGEGSDLDPATSHTLAKTFLARIQKAAAAS